MAVRLAAGRERRHRMGLPQPRSARRARQQPRHRQLRDGHAHPRAHGRPHLRVLGRHAPGGRVSRPRGHRGADRRHHREQRRRHLPSGRARPARPHARRHLRCLRGVFGTPLAGAFFGMEMCTIGKLNYSAGLYCLVASFTGDLVARGLGIAHTRNVIESVPAMEPGDRRARRCRCGGVRARGAVLLPCDPNRQALLCRPLHQLPGRRRRGVARAAGGLRGARRMRVRRPLRVAGGCRIRRKDRAGRR